MSGWCEDIIRWIREPPASHRVNGLVSIADMSRWKGSNVDQEEEKTEMGRRPAIAGDLVICGVVLVLVSSYKNLREKEMGWGVDS
jgi:hypothetical protein